MKISNTDTAASNKDTADPPLPPSDDDLPKHSSPKFVLDSDEQATSTRDDIAAVHVSDDIFLDNVPIMDHNRKQEIKMEMSHDQPPPITKKQKPAARLADSLQQTAQPSTTRIYDLGASPPPTTKLPTKISTTAQKLLARIPSVVSHKKKKGTSSAKSKQVNENAYLHSSSRNTFPTDDEMFNKNNNCAEGERKDASNDVLISAETINAQNNRIGELERSYDRRIQELERNHDRMIQELERNYDRRIRELEENRDSRIRELEGNYDRRIRDLRQSDEEEQRPLIAEDVAPVIRELLKVQMNETLKQQRQEMNETINALETKSNQQLEEMNRRLISRNRRGRGFSIFLNADGGQRAGDDDGPEEDVFSLMMLNKCRGVWPHPFPRILQFCIRTLCILFGVYLSYPYGTILLWDLQNGQFHPPFIPCIILGIIMIILPTKIARYLQPPQISILCRLIPCIYIIYYIAYYTYGDYILYMIAGMTMIVMSRKIAIMLKYILYMSAPWALGLVTFGLFQIGLGYAIIYDQLVNTGKDCDKNVGGDNCVPFGIPYRVGTGVTFARYVTVLLVLATQTDILTSIQTVLLLRNSKYVKWNEVIGEPEDSKTWGMWILRILIPNVLKLIQGVVILFASFIVIVQSDSIIDLLKDSTALLFVSQSDNIVFYLADLGYLGEDLKQKAAEVKAARWPAAQLEGNEEGNNGENESSGDVSTLRKYVRHHFSLHVFILFLLSILMIGALSYVVVREIDGTWMKRKYPHCDVDKPRLIGNGKCNYWLPGEFLYSSEKCGYDGGDCDVKPVDKYPNCLLPLELHYLIGNGICFNVAPFNSEQCGFDGGDCVNITNEGYPECKVDRPDYIGDGDCYDRPPYNTEICGFDGGDCVPKPVDGYDGCMVHDPYTIGDGWCYDKPPYNSEICGFDGGDCVPKPVDGYPNCILLPQDHYRIGDGWCDDFPPYNTEICGFDGGDCVPKPVDRYPNCTILPQDHCRIGDGWCDDFPPYNTEICGFDGGDCLSPP